MRRSILLVPLLLALALAAPAFGGGFATVGLSSTPAGVGPGETWTVDVTVLAHGRTPAEGVSPSVRISAGDETQTFPATATGKPGVYRAEVTFPERGKWTYEVNDGYGVASFHKFPPVAIGADGPVAAAPASAPASAPAPAADDGDGIAAGWLLGAAVALLLALAVLGVDRRGRPEPV